MKKYMKKNGSQVFIFMHLKGATPKDDHLLDALLQQHSYLEF